jgi:hypothetical protein
VCIALVPIYLPCAREVSEPAPPDLAEQPVSASSCPLVPLAVGDDTAVPLRRLNTFYAFEELFESVSDIGLGVRLRRLEYVVVGPVTLSVLVRGFHWFSVVMLKRLLTGHGVSYNTCDSKPYLLSKAGDHVCTEACVGFLYGFALTKRRKSEVSIGRHHAIVDILQ